jgi:hypothetical protein
VPDGLTRTVHGLGPTTDVEIAEVTDGEHVGRLERARMEPGMAVAVTAFR